MLCDKYDYVMVLIMMMILNVGDLFMVVNSYMQMIVILMVNACMQK